MGATTTADFYNGMVIRYNGELCTVTEFHHVSPGNWRAFVRVNLKNLRTGRVIEQRFRAGEEIDAVRVEHQNWQFLYIDGEDYVFMKAILQLQEDEYKSGGVALRLPSIS